jgi:hypothetical protein
MNAHIKRHLHKKAPDPPKHHNNRDDNTSELQHSHFVSLRRHPRQTACAAFERRRERGEGVALVVVSTTFRGEAEGKYRRINNALVARIVVDVDCDAAKGRDFGR